MQSTELSAKFEAAKWTCAQDCSENATIVPALHSCEHSFQPLQSLAGPSSLLVTDDKVCIPGVPKLSALKTLPHRELMHSQSRVQSDGTALEPAAILRGKQVS